MGNWIGVDLDGTLAQYEGWVGELHIGEPVPEMVAHVRLWVSQGWEVRIFTARVNDPRRADIVLAIEDWCEKHLGHRLEVTCSKDLHCFMIVDDRAVSVNKNTGRLYASPSVETYLERARTDRKKQP